MLTQEEMTMTTTTALSTASGAPMCASARAQAHRATRAGAMETRATSEAGGVKPGWNTSRRSAFIGTGASAMLRSIGFTTAAGASMTPGTAFASAKSDPYADVLKEPGFPDKFPFGEKEMARYDESSDFIFYSQPRFVTHIDDQAIEALTKYYSRAFPAPSNDVALLDVCSSWISHYPTGYKAGKISGIGMNEDELKRNPILNDYAVRDLNEDPTFPYDDNTFDVVTNAVSVDYLTRPLEVMREINRVLKPGGLAIMSFSNRCFPTKAVSIWTGTGDLDHVWIVGAYYHFAGGFEPPSAEDISPNPGKSDPMYVVIARKPTA
jgi:SAM-dependent methyltransferase